MLNVELLSAIVFDAESWDQETGAINPAIVVRGELPSESRPFVVDRIYRGPQGYYDESWAVVDGEGRLVYQHPYGRIHLRGEMFEDRFRDTVKAPITVETAEEHQLVFVVSRTEIGRIPCFIDAPESATAAGVLGDALEATLKKSAIVWLTIPQPRGDDVTKPAWFVFQGGKVFVLTGPDEQELTNLPNADQVTLTARSKEDRSRIASVPASVRVVDPESDEWDRIAQLGLGTRLNLPDGEDAYDRWRSTCTMVELSPSV